MTRGRVLTSQYGQDGPLSRPCPKCKAPIGHSCRPLRSAGHAYPGERKAVVHKERRASDG